jgi:hypothetical protein
MAPLDIKFAPDGSLAYVTFHGSWDRDGPVGYKLSVISFADGKPVEPPTSKTAAVDILSNADISQCPGKCFRPAGLAIDGKGHIWMTSDATGEIYVLQKVEVSTTGPGTQTTATSTSNGGQNAAAGRHIPWSSEWLLLGLTLAISFVVVPLLTAGLRA